MPDYKMDIRGKLGLSEDSDIYDYAYSSFYI